MSEWALLAPGPSARLLARELPDLPLGVVGNAYELVPRAAFLVAADRGWWLKHPAALGYPARRFCLSADVPGVEKVGNDVGLNSGVLALEIAKTLGATRIRLFGFDMHGDHFFGPYTNGLRNTSDTQRARFFRQYEEWARTNPAIEVVNFTPGSALRCFPLFHTGAAGVTPASLTPEPGVFSPGDTHMSSNTAQMLVTGKPYKGFAVGEIATVPAGKVKLLKALGRATDVPADHVATTTVNNTPRTARRAPAKKAAATKAPAKKSTAAKKTTTARGYKTRALKAEK